MPISSTAKEVKESILNLSVDNFEEYSKRLPTVVEATFRRAKFVGDRPYIADSTKLKFTGINF